MPDVTKTPAASDTVLTSDETVAANVPAVPSTGKPRSLWSDAWQQLRRNPLFVISALLIVLLLVMAIAPTLFTSVDPRSGDLTNHFMSKPEWGHVFSPEWFGYDKQGRSIYARVIYGARASISVGVLVTIAVTILGGLIGMLAGYYGGWIDSVLSRFTDIFFGIPFFLGAMVILTSFTDRELWVVAGSMAFLGWTQIARVMRGSVITTKQSDYVTAARALGAGTGRILFRHILPNAIAPVIVVATIALGGYIAAEATLSYLGLGLADPTISWGIDISDAKDALRDAPHVMFFPAGMLCLTVLAFIMLGDAVRDALDPKLR
ncbi:Stage 0 sporulation protein KC [Streptomyces netropsis]|nr:Stage 0 sporulation protein KC [Streptomyces netropsis]